MTQIFIHIFIILVCCFALGKGASWLVDSASRIAKRLGISELVIGLTIVAFGSSAPEFAVTISAAWAGNADISVGNIVGSNIFNIGFILGGCAIAAVVKIKRALVWRDGGVLLLITGLLGYMILDNQISRYDGFILSLCMLIYLLILFVKKEMVIEDGESHEQASWKDVPLLILGLALIAGGGHFLVVSAEKLAILCGLSKWVIGITVVAAGTSVPEFVISLVAIMKKHHGISAGNLIGSNLFNTMGVLGVAGAISPVPLLVESSAMVSVMMLIGLTVLVLVLMRTGWRLVRWEGFLIVGVGLAIWIYNFLVLTPKTGGS